MAHGAIAVDERGAPRSFLVRWVYSTNHKDIGTLYLTSAFIAGIIGMVFSVIFRLELLHPARRSSATTTTCSTCWSPRTA